MLSSSHLKITCHLYMWKGHYCYGIIYKSCLLQQKNIYINVKWCDLFHWCLYIKKIMEHYMATWGYKNLKFLCGKIFHLNLFFNIPREILYFQAAMHCKVLHVYIMYIDLFIHLSWLFTLYLLLIDRMYCCTSCCCPRQLILLTVNTETWCGKLEIV